MNLTYMRLGHFGWRLAHRYGTDMHPVSIKIASELFLEGSLCSSSPLETSRPRPDKFGVGSFGPGFCVLRAKYEYAVRPLVFSRSCGKIVLVYMFHLHRAFALADFHCGNEQSTRSCRQYHTADRYEHVMLHNPNYFFRYTRLSKRRIGIV